MPNEPIAVPMPQQPPGMIAGPWWVTFLLGILSSAASGAAVYGPAEYQHIFAGIAGFLGLLLGYSHPGTKANAAFSTK